MFHALRHTHVSALIAAGLDVVAISRRVGHGSPVTTLRTYGHPFNKIDTAAAAAIEAALRTASERLSGLPGASPVPTLGLPRARSYAKCLRCLDGDVAEWLKAAVC
jgi:hypothetical protein